MTREELANSFKCRASAIGKIMTQPKSNADKAAGVLSQTAKTYCDEWVQDQLFRRREDISSKFTAKGHLVEDKSIEFMEKMLGVSFLTKNTEQYENEWFTGEPDVLPQFMPHLDWIYDAKNSYTYKTFPYKETELENKDYWWQGQGYMALTGRSKYGVVYMLTDAPDHMIESEAWKYCRLYGMDELDGEIYRKYERNMTYSDLPDEMRFKLFTFEKDYPAIIRAQEAVEKCRAYILESTAHLPVDENGHLLMAYESETEQPN